MIFNDFDKLTKDIDDLYSEVKESSSVASTAEMNASVFSHREGRTRSTLTISFMVGFFLLLVLSCLFVIWYNSCVVDWVLIMEEKNVPNAGDLIKPLELDKVLSIVISALGTSLGFIIGYYFKDKK